MRARGSVSVVHGSLAGPGVAVVTSLAVAVALLLDLIVPIGLVVALCAARAVFSGHIRIGIAGGTIAVMQTRALADSVGRRRIDSS